MSTIIKALKSVETQNNTVFNGRTEDRGLVFQFTFSSRQKFILAEKELKKTNGYRVIAAAVSISGDTVVTKFKFSKA